MNDPDFELAKDGKMAILGGLTKALTAFAVLQNVTHKRTMEQMRLTVMWKGLVVEEEENEQLQYNGASPPPPPLMEEQDENGTDVLQELEDILATGSDDNTWQQQQQQYPVYEISTSTKRTTTRTTRIRPIDPTKSEWEQPKAKYIVVRSNEEDAESFMAVVDSNNNEENNSNQRLPGPWIEHALDLGDDKQRPNNSLVRGPSKGLKIMLSAVSKKLSRKKIERQVKYGHEEKADGGGSSSSSDADNVTVTTSTSTTLRSTAAQYTSNSNEKQQTTAATEKAPERSSIKRKPSWSRFKLKGARRKSVSNLFLKGTDAMRKKQSPPTPPPPLPHKLLDIPAPRSRSNSVTNSSISSISRTLTTTTYTTTPSQSSSSPKRQVEQRQRTLIRSPSLPLNHLRKRKPSPLDTEPDPRNFPRDHIIKNMARFMRYSSAAYGESFMRILGIGDIPSELPNSHHPNHHAFAHHTRVSVNDILLSSYTDTSFLSVQQHVQLHALVHYVTVDHTAQAIVLTCRGTLGLSDILTDLTCDYAEFKAADGRTYSAHGGMLEAAQLLAEQKGKVYQAVLQGLEAYPSYGLVLCGHSLGAGVASLLSVLWSEEREKQQQTTDHPVGARALMRDPVPFVTAPRSGLPPGRPMHCYTYGPPSTMSLELSEYCARGLVTSVVHAFDIVPSLSLGLLKDFKNIAVSLYRESSVADDILSRIMGRYQKEKSQKEEEEEEEQWFWALIKTMRADMRAEKLYPPGTVFLVESTPELIQRSDARAKTQHGTAQKSKHKQAHMVALNRCEDVQKRFSEIMFSRTMFLDHSPSMYEKAIRHLCKGYFGTHV